MFVKGILDGQLVWSALQTVVLLVRWLKQEVTGCQNRGVQAKNSGKHRQAKNPALIRVSQESHMSKIHSLRPLFAK